ncbi:MAG TPA: hypothetical protein VIU64_22725 [Polyangia bacterium]
MNTLSAGWLLWATLVALADPAPSGMRVPAPPLALQVVGACPTQGAVMSLLSPVLAADSLPAAAEPPRVIDLGDRYVVAAAGQSGLYSDPGRDCGERARVAAVFIALALNPPALAAASPAPVAAPPPEPLPRPVAAKPPSPAGRAWREVAVAGRVDLAFDEADAPGDVTAGPELRLATGREEWGVALTAAALWPTTTQFAAVSVRQQRFPFGATVVFRRPVKSWLELGGEAGLALAVLRLRANEIEANTASTRLDLGARLVLEAVGPRGDGWALFAALRGEIFPRVYVLDTDPLKKVGVTHHYWWGASLGISFEAP